MPVMDEFKEERAALKQGTFKQKARYVWDYYRWYFIGGAIAAVCLFTLVRDIVTHKDAGFYACMLNGAQIDVFAEETENMKNFAEYASIDTEEYQVLFDTSIQIGTPGADDYTSAQKLMIYIASQEIDVIATDVNSMLKYAYQGNFADLTTMLSPEQMEKYKDSFYYLDKVVQKEYSELDSTEIMDTPLTYPDPTKPEEMTEPIPIGVKPGASCPLLTEYAFNGDLFVGIVLNTTRPEKALKFIDYVMQ